MAGSLRLTGGRYGGRRLVVPSGVRPTEGRVREALFSIWGAELPGCRFLDLFAGSGAVGLEAAGRGAAVVVFAEASGKVLKRLAGVVAELEATECRLRRLRLPSGLASLAADGPFDLVFADPPYDFEAYDELLAGVVPLLAPGGRVAVERSARSVPPSAPEGLAESEERRYGESALSFYERLTSPTRPG